MSGGDGVFALASSHALTSRKTLESGRVGRIGGRIGGRDETCLLSTDVVGAKKITSIFDTSTHAGFVHSRSGAVFWCMYTISSAPFNLCRDIASRTRFCSHSLTVLYFLFDEKKLLSLLVKVMLSAGGAFVCENVVL